MGRKRTKMKFYHRTTTENWEKIKKEGILWGIGMSYRHTYLSPDIFDKSYGDIILEVKYEPKGPPFDNYGFNPPKGQHCWQFSVFVPIDISEVKRIKSE